MHHGTRALKLVGLLVLFLGVIAGLNFFLASQWSDQPVQENTTIVNERPPINAQIDVQQEREETLSEKKYVLLALMPTTSEVRWYALEGTNVTFLRSIELTRIPSDIAVADNLLYVAGDDGTGWVDVYDFSTYRITRRYTLEGASNLLVGDDVVYVSAPEDKVVYVLDKDTAVVQKISLPHTPGSLLYERRNNLMYTPYTDSNHLGVLNPTILRFVGDIRLVGTPRTVVLNHDGTILLVPVEEEDVLSFVPLRLSRETDRVAVGDGPVDVVVGGGGTYAFVANERGGSVSVVSLTQQKHVVDIPVGDGPSVLALHPDGDFLYVAARDLMLSVIDTASLHIENKVPLGADVKKLLIIQQ